MTELAKTISRVANKSFSHSRKIMPAQPWWENLESNFHKFPDDFELDVKTDLMVGGTAFLDLCARATAANLVSALAFPSTLRPRQLRRDWANADFYQSMAKPSQIDNFFARPDSSRIRIDSKPGGLATFKPGDGICETLSFDSNFVAVNPNMREIYPRNLRNMRAIAQHWRHGDRPRPTLCVIHGFLADPYWLNRMFFALPWFYRQGYDLLLYTLPHHGSRSTKFAPFSGHGFFANGLSNLNESFAHAVHDFRIFMDYLENNGVSNIGVTGISLGGYTTSLLASVEDRLSFAIPNVPVVSLIDLVMEWFPANLPLKAIMKLTNTSISEVRHFMGAHSALTHRPKLPKERLMIVAGAGDRLAPPKQARLLWDHWDRPRIHWFPGNHVFHLDRGRYLREIAQFIRETGFDDM